jgi:DNA (cytosine-5)-methyltransferase 1
MIHGCEITLGKRRKSPRIWMESKVRLLASGFVSGCHYTMTSAEGKLTLVVTDMGERRVSKKEKNGSVVPVLDMNSAEILQAFPEEMIGQKLYARFYEGKIVITVLPTAEAVVERENRFLQEIKSEKGLSKVSLFTGSGFLDNAVSEGLLQSGIKSHTAFTNELDDRYLSNGLENNPALSGASSVQGSIATLHRFDVPKSSLFVAGSPCVGVSKSGKSKNQIQSELEHEQAGHLFIYLINAILQANPAICILENTPEGIDSTTFNLVERVLVEQGYKIQKTIINSYYFGSLEERKRMAFVAVSEGLEVDINALQETGEPEITVGDVLDDEVEESAWSGMTYLFDKQERDIAAGKGFRMHIVDENSKRVSTIGKSYQKNRSTETKVSHPSKTGLYRLFTPSEHAKIKGFSPDLVQGLPKTTAHEVLGNGVVAHGFKSLACLIGHQVSSERHQENTLYRPIAGLHDGDAIGYDEVRSVFDATQTEEQMALF